VKAVTRKSPAGPKRKKPVKRSPRVVEPGLPKVAADTKKGAVGVPAAPDWYEKEARKKRLAELRKLREPPIAALDPQYDDQACRVIGELAGQLQSGRPEWPETPFYTTLIAMAGDDNVALRAFALIEDAIDRIFPEGRMPQGRVHGVMWLNDRYAKVAGDIVFVLQDVIETMSP
jgi:hypothetical protein